MKRFLRWWRQLWCSHRHGTIGGSPLMGLYRDYLAGRATLDDYRLSALPMDRTECLRCGKVWSR